MKYYFANKILVIRECIEILGKDENNALTNVSRNKLMVGVPVWALWLVVK